MLNSGGFYTCTDGTVMYCQSPPMQSYFRLQTSSHCLLSNLILYQTYCSVTVDISKMKITAGGDSNFVAKTSTRSRVLRTESNSIQCL